MIIVLTRPDFFEGEVERITDMLTSGRADLIHIRKPEASRDEIEQLLCELSSDLYNRLVLHDHFDLAVKYALRGVHLNRRNPHPPSGGQWSGDVSISCHSLAELAECRRKPYAYMSLSPIFDSISKRGYRSAFKLYQLTEARQKGLIDHRVMALGGVTFDKINLILKIGFGGAMILGDAWK